MRRSGKRVRATLLAGGPLLMLAAGFAASFWWNGDGGSRPVAEPREKSRNEQRLNQNAEHGAAAAEPSPRGLSAQRWDVVETVGEEGALVETVYDPERGYEIVGWRVKGIGLYGAPPFQVPARKWDDIPLFPCSDCHNKRDIDYTPRKMVEEHEELIVDHANDRLWCTDCHDGKGLDFLTSRRGKPIDMDLGHLHCGECHFEQLKDWEFGVHGLRIGLFAGGRVLRTCTECHDAHRPQIQPDAPSPPPQARENLRAFMPKPRRHGRVWERFAEAP